MHNSNLWNNFQILYFISQNLYHRERTPPFQWDHRYNSSIIFHSKTFQKKIFIPKLNKNSPRFLLFFPSHTMLPSRYHHSAASNTDDIRGIREISERGGEKFEANYFNIPSMFYNIPPFFSPWWRNRAKNAVQIFSKLRNSRDNSWSHRAQDPPLVSTVLSTMHRQTRKYAGRQTEVRNSINLWRFRGSSAHPLTGLRNRRCT